jgi:hypothetical protein
MLLKQRRTPQVSGVAPCLAYVLFYFRFDDLLSALGQRLIEGAPWQESERSASGASLMMCS